MDRGLRGNYQYVFTLEKCARNKFGGKVGWKNTEQKLKIHFYSLNVSSQNSYVETWSPTLGCGGNILCNQGMKADPWEWDQCPYKIKAKGVVFFPR